MVRVNDRPSWLRRSRATLDAVAEVIDQRRLARGSHDKMIARRDERARSMVMFASSSVPWYREALADADLNPREIRTAADLSLLPLVERSQLQSTPQAFRGAAEQEGLLLSTTGSTAAPLEVLHDRAAMIASIAHAERTRAVEASFVGRRYRYRVLRVYGGSNTGMHVLEFYARELYRPFRPKAQGLTVATPPGEVVAAIEAIRPDVFRSYGAFTELVFRTAAASGGLRHRPSVAVYSGDTMSSAGRELIEKELGLPVLSNYNAVECLHIAFTCEARKGFHIHEDLCHVRLVDSEGRSVPPGEPGEVVLSNLVNRGTVLLNYRLGDVARLDETPCACGRASPRLIELEGRIDEVIDLGDGRIVYPTELWGVFRGRQGVLRYQLAQVADRRFELRVVTSGAEGRSAAELAGADLVRLLDGASVLVNHVEDLPTGPGGKFRHVVPLRPPHA